MRFGLDYAWTTIPPSAHKALGSTFAIRYLSHDQSKNLSKAELAQLRGGGIDVVVVWETTAMRALEGRAAGAQDARDALGRAQALGIPAGRPIYFACDFDETPGQAPSVADYFRGVHDVLDNAGPVSFPHPVPVGAYGGYWVIKRLFDLKLISYGYQTYAWSGGQLDRRAQLYQFSNDHRVSGRSVDYDHALAADFGQWSFKAAPKPVPHPSGPVGVAHFAGTFDTQTGHWTVRGTAGTFRPGGPHKQDSVELQFDPADGTWRSEPLPLNAPPLGGP